MSSHLKAFWMPLYVPDYLADTMHLTVAENGMYLLLIMHYWMNGGLPETDRELASITRCDIKTWRRKRKTMQAFFRNGWHHKRIDAELEKMHKQMENRRLAGSKGGTMSVISRERDRGRFTKRSLKPSPSSAWQTNQANVNHSPKKDITTTCSVAAREEEKGLPGKEGGPAQPPKPKAASDHLAAIIQRRGWVKH